MLTTLIAASPFALTAIAVVLALIATYTFIVFAILIRAGLAAANPDDVPQIVAAICTTIRAMRQGRRRG